MMLKAPRWCKQAVPTLKGWADPSTNELFVARRFTQKQIDEFFNEINKEVDTMYGIDHDYTKPSEVTEEVVYEAPQMLHEAPPNHKGLEDLTKSELVALAEQLGVKVSARSTKKTLIEKLS